MLEDEYDMAGAEGMEPVDDGVDAFANVGQGLVGGHKTAMLQYWQQVIDDIERISDDGSDTDVFKSTVLPLARIKKVMKTDLDVKMISAEAPILFAKGCDIFITELTMRAWIHAEENKRRTLQRSDIAMAIQKSDVFDFLIDIIPREEAQPRRSHRVHDSQFSNYSSNGNPHGSNNMPSMPGMQNSQNMSNSSGLNSQGMSNSAGIQNSPGMQNAAQNMQNSQNMINGMPSNLTNSLGPGMPNSLGMNGNMQMNPMDLSVAQLNQTLPHQQLSQMQQMQQSHQLNPNHLNQLQQTQSQRQQTQNQNSTQNHNRQGNGSAQQEQSQPNQLNALTDVANLNIDINSINSMASLGTGIDAQMSNLSYGGMEFSQPGQNMAQMSARSPYMDSGALPSAKEKRGLKPTDDDGPGSKQTNTRQDSPFAVKDETTDEPPQFPNELPFSYNESVDVSPFGQNF